MPLPLQLSQQQTDYSDEALVGGGASSAIGISMLNKANNIQSKANKLNELAKENINASNRAANIQANESNKAEHYKNVVNKRTEELNIATKAKAKVNRASMYREQFKQLNNRYKEAAKQKNKEELNKIIQEKQNLIRKAKNDAALKGGKLNDYRKVQNIYNPGEAAELPGKSGYGFEEGLIRGKVNAENAQTEHQRKMVDAKIKRQKYIDHAKALEEEANKLSTKVNNYKGYGKLGIGVGLAGLGYGLLKKYTQGGNNEIM